MVGRTYQKVEIRLRKASTDVSQKVIAFGRQGTKSRNQQLGLEKARGERGKLPLN